MATQIPVTVRRDHLEQLAQSARPMEALAELVWNAFDAEATRVEIRFGLNALGGLETIRVMDNGTGVFHGHASSLFGNLGDSWKKERRVGASGRPLHGRKGRGRFKAFALGAKVEWTTTCHAEHGGGLIDYAIRGDYSKLDHFSVDAPSPSTSSQTGTWVILQNLHKDYPALLGEKGLQALAEQFGPYLTAYPGLELIADGKRVDPALAQLSTEKLTVTAQLPEQGELACEMTLIEWKQPVDRYLHLCDEHGFVLHSVKPGPTVRSKGGDFTAHLCSPLLRTLAYEGRLELEDMDPVLRNLLEAARQQLRACFQAREARQTAGLFERWKQEGVYPYPVDAAPSPQTEQLFKEAALQVHQHLPQLASLGTDMRGFVYALLADLVQQQPSRVPALLESRLGLDKKGRERLEKLTEA